MTEVVLNSSPIRNERAKIGALATDASTQYSVEKMISKMEDVWDLVDSGDAKNGDAKNGDAKNGDT